MADSFIYGNHPERIVRLSETERVLMASSPVPIKIFWNVLIRLQDPDQWPVNRRYTSAGGNTTTGVFVMYQSDQEPIPTFGLSGDLWLTSTAIYYKEEEGHWSLWEKNLTYRCPYAPQRRLAWSRNAHFKYLTFKSVKCEQRRWDKEGVPNSCIPTGVRDAFPDITTAINKSYDRLEVADCVRLLHAHCDHLCGENSNRIAGHGSDGQLMDIGTTVEQHNKGNEVNKELHEEPQAIPQLSSDDLELRGELGMQPEIASNSEIISSEPNIAIEYCAPSAQPTYTPFPVDKYLTPLSGRKSSGYMRCSNGMKVFLPFTSRGPDQNESSRLSACKWLLSGSDATAPLADGRPSIVAVLDSPSHGSHISSWADCGNKVRKILSEGRVAVVSGGEENHPLYSWDEQSLSIVARCEGQGAVFQWHSALKDEEHELKNKKLETIKGSIREFLAADLDLEDSINCLDILTIGDEIPRLISLIATSAQALSNTSGITFRYSHTVPQHPATAEAAEPQVRRSSRKRENHLSVPPAKRPRSEEATEYRSMISSDLGETSTVVLKVRQKRGLAAILRKAVTVSNHYGGMHSIEWDVVRPMRWALFSSDGAMSDVHFDGGGYCTWLRCEMGGKMWGYAVPETPARDLVQAMKDYHRLVTTDTAKFRGVAKPVQILLTPGKTLIQGPAALHIVYTVEKSIFTGGHFYTLDTMHLTEVARSCAVYTKQCGTNASHPGSTRLLSRIMISLAVDWKKSVLRKPFISLARMLIWAHLYAPGDVDPDERTFEPNQESKGELAAAQAIAEAILEHNDMFIDDIRPHKFKTFRWLSAIGEGSDWTDWTDPGTVQFNIPDMRPYFRAFDGVLQG